jgi:hypothetical protein
MHFEGQNVFVTAIKADSRYGFVPLSDDMIDQVFDRQNLAVTSGIADEPHLSDNVGYVTVVESGTPQATIRKNSSIDSVRRHVESPGWCRTSSGSQLVGGVLE